SIMGIFSLDLSKPIELDIHSDDDAACDAFLKKIASFVTSE
ncbi:MAG TPA: HPr family phosphocarrier protein, partial [Candidatus Egerieisoma faecipullorum]|nr:HPr family phosphocarrier protein [Candidatus Egerieisoma faecipullorum]